MGAALTRPLGSLADELGVLAVLAVVVALVLAQHHLQVHVVAGLEPPQGAACFLVQGHGRRHVAALQQVVLDEHQQAPLPQLGAPFILQGGDTMRVEGSQ